MIHPFLTTYRQNTAAIAHEAVRLLLEAIESPDTHQPRQIIAEGALLEGETVSVLPAEKRKA